MMILQDRQNSNMKKTLKGALSLTAKALQLHCRGIVTFNLTCCHVQPEALSFVPAVGLITNWARYDGVRWGSKMAERDSAARRGSSALVLRSFLGDATT
jgi:hypothetical protein